MYTNYGPHIMPRFKDLVPVVVTLIGGIIQPLQFLCSMHILTMFLNHAISQVASRPYDSRLGFQLGKSTVTALQLCMYINFECTMYSPSGL